MTIRHHQSDELLLDYACGALSEAWSLALATHLALCPDCRRALGEAEALGGALLEAAEPAPVAPGALDAVLARLDSAPAEPPIPGPAPEGGPLPELPEPLRGHVLDTAGTADLDRLPWRRLGLHTWHLPLRTGDPRATARLLRVPPGGAVPDHGHRGLELALVLRGAYADVTGRYARGDLQQTDETVEHRPRAEPGPDCVCLVVTDAPLRFRSLAVRLAQPLLGI